MTSEVLLAENTATHKTDSAGNAPVASGQEHATAGQTAAAPSANAETAHGEKAEGGGGAVFSELFGTMGDHNALSIGPIHADLPYILIDNGFHFFANKEALNASGTYTTDHHGKAVYASDHHHKPALDLSVTNFVFLQWFVMALLFLVLKIVAGKYKKNPAKAPKGIQNAIEAVVIYIRDEVVYSNCGKRIGDRLMPYFLTLFFFIAGLNLLGLIPLFHSATGAIPVTAGLAVTAFFMINFTAIREAGFGAWLHHLLGGAPSWLAPIMVPIEIIGLFSKPFALTVRLFANMTAGHVILLSLIGLIFFFKTIAVAPVTILFSLFIYCLELFVAFLQAFVFTTLTAVFIGMAVGDHKDEHGHGHAH